MEFSFSKKMMHIIIVFVKRAGFTVFVYHCKVSFVAVFLSSSNYRFSLNINCCNFDII